MIRDTARAGVAATAARPLRLARAAVPAAALALCAGAQASDAGPFRLTGFGKAEIGRESTRCKVYGSLDVVHDGRLGLSSMSMPGNAAFTGIDSRAMRHGNGLLAGAVHVF